MLESSGQFAPPNLISLLNTTATGEGDIRVDYLKELCCYLPSLKMEDVPPGVMGAFWCTIEMSVGFTLSDCGSAIFLIRILYGKSVGVCYCVLLKPLSLAG
jgi:hypothetical protein